MTSSVSIDLCVARFCGKQESDCLPAAVPFYTPPFLLLALSRVVVSDFLLGSLVRTFALMDRNLPGVSLWSYNCSFVSNPQEELSLLDL